MARQMPFSEYEAILLLDAFLQTLSGKVSRGEAIRGCSDALRRMAVNSGVEIDGVYRNINGITFQMASMESAYRGETLLKPATRLFRETVEKYKSNRQDYEKKLREAKEMSNDKSSNEELFMAWLSHKVSPAQLSELYLAFQEIEQQAKKVKLVNHSLYENVEISLFKKIKNNIEQSKIFKIVHKRQMGRINSSLNFLIQYAQEHSDYDKGVSESILRHTAKIEKDVESADEAMISGKKVRTVNFNTEQSMIYTKPVAFTYFGERKEDDSWRTLYVDLCKCILDDYPDCFKQMMNDCISRRTRVWLVDEKHLHMLTVPKLIGNGSYVEVNRSASDIIKSVQWILERCNVDCENVVIEYIERENKEVQPVAPKLQAQVKLDTKPYCIILEDYFPKGYRLGSTIEMKKFRRYYEDANGAELQLNDGAAEAAIRQSGIEHNGRVYAPQTMLGEDLKDRLFQYMETCFADGKTALYFDAVFQVFSEEFLDHNIYDANMLKTYITYMAGNNYYIGKNYFSNGQRIADEPIEMIRTYLKEQRQPIDMDDVCQTLSHIPEKRIKTILGSNLEFVYNGQGKYFHADALEVSEEDVENISAIMNAEIESHEYISGNELYDVIKSKYPYLYERNMVFSALGWRDALKYKLDKKYSFAGNIISEKGRNLSMSDVFLNYAKRRDEFTLRELLVFAGNMNTTVYFDALYEYAARISLEQFVRKDAVSFQVEETDKILNQYCTGAYYAIPKIKDFGIFPEASHPWTIFLLEHYLAQHSKHYDLMHFGYNQSVAVGAMVKRDKPYADFSEFIADVLADCDVTLQKDTALNYLYEHGYIARRSYAKVETVLINARAKRNKKEK